MAASPIVTITFPTEGQTVSGTINIRITNITAEIVNGVKTPT
jgi:hypothetical protein